MPWAEEVDTTTMIERLDRAHGLRGGVPFLLSSIHGVARMEAALHEAGIPWRSIGEGHRKGVTFKQAQEWGRCQRWVLFVRKADLEAATRIARTLRLREEARLLPVRFTSGALCRRHDYELEPCSGCSTGYDWWGKADEAEKEKPPFRRPSPL